MLPESLLGIVLAIAVRAGEFRRVALAPVLLAATVAWAVGLALPRAFHVAAITLVPFALVIVAAAWADRRRRRAGC